MVGGCTGGSVWLADWHSTLQGKAVGTYELEPLAAISAADVLPAESDLIRPSQSNGALLQKISQGQWTIYPLCQGEMTWGPESAWHLVKSLGVTEPTSVLQLGVEIYDH